MKTGPLLYEKQPTFTCNMGLNACSRSRFGYKNSKNVMHISVFVMQKHL